jgi:hypothetical protein
MGEFIIFKNAQASFATESASCSMDTRPFFGERAAVSEVQNSHPYSAEVKKDWTHISTSYTASWHVHEKIMNFNL